MNETVLITGGTGLVGKRLINLLLSQGYNVNVLSRKPSKKEGKINYYHWNISFNEIDKDALTTADHIIHLVGENVGKGRWSLDRKKEILESRTRSTKLLEENLIKIPHKVQTFISASATGYYGTQTTEREFFENDEPGTDFLSKVCVEWESAVHKIENLGIRTVILRTGVVFAKQKSALQKIVFPFKLGLGSSLGTGKQIVPWIHLNDLTKMYLLAINNPEMNGAYNAVVGDRLSNTELSKKIAKILKRPFVMPKVPVFLLKLVLGEMAVIVTEGSQVNAAKIRNAGFVFEYELIDVALTELLINIEDSLED